MLFSASTPFRKKKKKRKNVTKGVAKISGGCQGPPTLYQSKRVIPTFARMMGRIQEKFRLIGVIVRSKCKPLNKVDPGHP